MTESGSIFVTEVLLRHPGLIIMFGSRFSTLTTQAQLGFEPADFTKWGLRFAVSTAPNRFSPASSVNWQNEESWGKCCRND